MLIYNVNLINLIKIQSFELMMRFFITYLIFCLFIFEANGQGLHFNYLSVNDGLSQHDVSSIIQDSEGYIWIGTYDGLNRFDGHRIENIFHLNEDDNSLSSNRIQALFEDDYKRLWIGTDGYGLNYYDLQTGIIERVSVPDNFKIINDISQNDKGEILAATAQGLLKVTQQENGFLVEVVQTPLTGFNVRKMKTLNNGELLFATNNGVWLGTNNNNYRQIEGSESMVFLSLAGNDISNLWVGGENDLFQIIDEKLIPLEDIQNTYIHSISLGNNNNVWVATSNKGLLSVEKNTLQVNSINSFNNLNQQLTINNPFKYVYIDNTSTLWTSNKMGVLYTNLEDKNFESIPIQKLRQVRTLFATDTDLIFGLQTDAFYKFNFETQQVSEIELPKNSRPFKVDTLNGKIHLATSSGLFKEEDLSTNTFSRAPIFTDSKEDEKLIVTSFCTDPFGNQYFGTLKGLVFKDKTGASFIDKQFDNLESLRNVRVFTLKYDAFENSIWVGTISDGLFKINLEKRGQIQSVERYNEQMVGSYNIPNNSIWCFHQNEDGSLYIGTDTGLLLKQNNQEQIKSISDENISNKKIMGIVRDDVANLWLTNSRGIIMYNPEKNISKKYNSFDGLLTNTFTEAVSRNTKGQLFFGNILGINYFQSSSLQRNNFPSKVIFTKLLVNNEIVKVNEELFGSVLLSKTINNTSQLNFNYHQNDFTIQFSSTNFANNKVNKYRYKLENYDEDWIEVNNNNRLASYSNIPSGSYKFMLEATNPEGDWTEDIRTISINVTPAPWRTWWAYTLYVIVIILVVGTIFYFWLNKEKLRNQVELSKLKNKQEKEMNEMKLIFFTDIAHEFKTPLSLVIGPIEDLVRGNITTEHREFCYNILSRNTNRMLNLINQLLDFRKVSSGVNILRVSRNDISAELKGIVNYFAWEEKNSNVNLRLIAPESYFCHFDKDILEKVVFNILSNAFKYTPFGGLIEIELKPTWKNDLEYVIILIKDSGKGIPQEDKRKIFERHFHGKERSSSGIGLHLSATLVEAHKGEINVSNSSLGGTEFMITLPVSSTAFSVEEYLSEDEISPVLSKNYVPGESSENEDIIQSDSKDKVLIVEDDHDLRKYLKNILIYDYNVIEATNGKEGYEVCLKEMPDMIITDVMMPEVDGIELCKLIKKNVLISHIPVLMLTAKTGEEFSKEGLQVGAWDYIAKPFNSYQLLLKVKNILNTRNNFRLQIVNGSYEETENHYISYDQKFVQNAKAIIADKITEPDFSVEFLAKELGLSRMQLHRKLSSLTGLSTTSFINKIRIETAVKMFDNGCDRVQEAMDAVGITSYAHFNLLFKKEKEMTPSKYIEYLKDKVTT